MNIQRLKAAEAQFMQTYPGGFENPEMVKIGKKHKVPQMTELCHEVFSQKACRNVSQTCENMIKVINRSSMISLFEKPKFRDMVNGFSQSERAFLVNALAKRLHDNAEFGFEAMLDLLKANKMAKWSLISIIPAYYYPTEEVFVKPTTAKNAIKYFDIPDLVYKPTPSWSFYQGFKAMINQAKTQVDKSLSPSNAAFSGFLMMSMQA